MAAAPDAGSDGAANTTGVRQSEAQTSRSPEQALLSVGVIALLIAAALGLALGVMALRRRRAGDQ
jgi:predicted amidohydrolase